MWLWSLSPPRVLSQIRSVYPPKIHPLVQIWSLLAQEKEKERWLRPWRQTQDLYSGFVVWVTWLRFRDNPVQAIQNLFTISWKPIALTHVDAGHFIDPNIHPDFIVLGQMMLSFYGQGCSSSWSQKILSTAHTSAFDLGQIWREWLNLKYNSTYVLSPKPVVLCWLASFVTET